MGEETETLRGSINFSRPKSREVGESGFRLYGLEQEQSFSLAESSRMSVKSPGRTEEEAGNLAFSAKEVIYHIFRTRGCTSS